MPKIRENLRTFNFGVLQDHLLFLEDRSAVFTLLVGDGFSERVIYWFDGRLFLLSTGDRSGPGIARHLVRKGELDERSLQVILDVCRKDSMALPDVLVRRQVLTSEELEVLNAKLIRDELLDLAFWDEGLYSSYPAPPPPDFFRTDGTLLSATVNAEQLRQDASAWIKTWMRLKSTLGEDTAILELTDSGIEAIQGQTGPGRRLLDACRTGATLREVWRTVDMELPRICDGLVDLIEEGYVAVVPDARLKTGRTLEQSISALEELLPRAVGKDLVRYKLVALYRKARQPDRACAHLEQLAQDFGSRSAWDAAAECFRTLLAIRPDDTSTLQQLIKLHLAHGTPRQARAAVLQVAQSLHRAGKRKPLETVARLMADIPDSSLECQEIRVDLGVLSGEHDRAIQEYLSLVASHEDRGDHERAMQVLGKAMALAPEDERLKKRLAMLKRTAARPAARSTGRSGRRLRRWPSLLAARMPTSRLACVLLAILMLSGWYALGFPPFGGSGQADAGGEDEGTSATEPTTVARVHVPTTSPAPPRRAVGAVEVVAVPVSGNTRISVVPGPAGNEAAGRLVAPARPATPVAPQSTTLAGGVSAAPSGGRPPTAAAGAGAVASRVDSKPGSASPSGTAGSLRAPAAGTSGASPLIFEAAPRAPCSRHGTHQVITLRVGADRMVRFADSCGLLLKSFETGATLELPGAEGSRWAFDPGFTTICAWCPGKPLILTRSFSPEAPRRTSWSVPAAAEAIVIAGDSIVLRDGATTRVYGLEKGELRSASLPSWDDGRLEGRRLILSTRGKEGGPGKVWEVDFETLRPSEVKEAEQGK